MDMANGASSSPNRGSRKSSSDIGGGASSEMLPTRSTSPKRSVSVTLQSYRGAIRNGRKNKGRPNKRPNR